MRSFRSTFHLVLNWVAMVDREELAELRRPTLYLLLQVVAKLLAVSVAVVCVRGEWRLGVELLLACVLMTWVAVASSRSGREPR
jgi:hypothetical protein